MRYLGALSVVWVGLLCGGVIPLLIALNEGSQYVSIRSGQYYLLDYSIYTAIRFFIIIAGTGLMYLIYLRPHKAIPLMSALTILCVVMMVMMIV